MGNTSHSLIKECYMSTAQQDAALEGKINALGLNAPRITPALIDSIMETVTYHTYVIPGTTTTVASAKAANGFVLAIESSAAASPANFNEVVGAERAIQKVNGKARDELWKLTGWQLKCLLTDMAAIAKKVHHVNRMYCIALGDYSQVPWDEAPAEIQKSVINGVIYHLDNPDATPESSHENWMNEKIANGWVYGTEKDMDLKTHPCIMPYHELPEAQRAKDSIFKAIVDAEFGRS